MSANHPTSRRTILGGLAASIAGSVAGLFGATRTATADGIDREAIERAAGTLRPFRTFATGDRIDKEMRRLHVALLDPATPPDRWLQCYAAQQALAWVSNPATALSPCKTIAEGRVRLAMSWHLPSPMAPVQADPVSAELAAASRVP